MAVPIPLGDNDRLVAQLTVDSPDGLGRCLEPITCGIPWPRGQLRETSQVAMTDAEGTSVPLQVRCLDRWADGSVRWSLLDWQASVVGQAVYNARVAPEGASPTQGPRVTVTSRPGGFVEVTTGRATFRLKAGSPSLFESVEVEGVETVDSIKTRLTAADGSGIPLEARSRSVEVIEEGPIRSAIRVEGDLAGPGARPLLLYVLDAHFFAGSATVRLELTLHNPREAEHPGGLWCLGGGGSVYLKHASLTLALPDGPGDCSASYVPECGRPVQRLYGDCELYQDSSGGENWSSINHINRDHVVPVSFRGYRLRHGLGEEHGLRATPAACVERDRMVLSLAMEHFWQNFPKAIEFGGGEITLRLFPAQFVDVHEIQGGEQKTHVFYAAFGPDYVTPGLLEWCRSPLLPKATPDWYCSSGAIPYLVPKSEDPNDVYLSLIDAAVEGPDTFERKREVVDEYGWRHFGDVYGDHEAVFHRGPSPLVSHYNNQYDNVAGFAYQYLRSGDRRWWSQMDQLARHVVDIDIYHTDRDRSAYNGGMFWHTCHYVDADTATHRTYPRAAVVGGGGPSGGHNYTTGLALHHFLTGDPRSRSAAISLGRWVIEMDDGRKAPFGWLDGHPHGHATASGSPTYHGPGRAQANSLNALLNAYRLTRDTEYLEKAEQIIRRCIHPKDDVNARNLLDAENKWFYTMSLQALGRYLDDKAEDGSTDRMYDYARESLLRYARWMAKHEYPYLDKPEILEYPTETWAAQDMRKSDVFKFAAKHAQSTERATFLERSEFFFHTSTTTLASLPTRTLARPVVLMLSNGYMHAYFQKYPEHASPLPPPRPDLDFGSPEVFVPQKARVLRKLKIMAAVGVIVVILAAAGLALSLLS
jgi:hypothetical protein